MGREYRLADDRRRCLLISPSNNGFGSQSLRKNDRKTQGCEAKKLQQAIIAKPELVYSEGTAPKLTRPSGSGDLARNSPGHRNSGFALNVEDKLPGVTRRNVISVGVDLNSLIGEEFEVQGVRFAGVCECSPCYWMDLAIAPGAEMLLKGRGGLRARILSDGVLRALR